MAAFISSLALAGGTEQVAEVLVKGAGIRSLEDLAKADPATVALAIETAIVQKQVKVPKGFTYSSADVQSWIKLASIKE